MPTDHPQYYCDWCFLLLSEDSRVRSRWLGLTSEDAWACTACLEAGHYRVPPEFWSGDAEDWLARDEYILSRDDLTAIVGALNEVLNGPDAIEQWEFNLRVGVPRTVAGSLMNRLASDADL
jgi:hypothetical protein